MRQWGRFVVTFVVALLWLAVPAIPVYSGPLVPDVSPSPTLMTPIEALIVLLGRPAGMAYRWGWYSYAGVAVWFVVGCLIVSRVFRMASGSPTP